MTKYFGYIGVAIGVLAFGLLIEFPIYSWMLYHYSNKKVKLNYKFLIKHSLIMLINIYIIYYYLFYLDLSLRIILFFFISLSYLFLNYKIISKEDRNLISKLIKEKI